VKREENMKVVDFCSATGVHIPPLVIFKGIIILDSYKQV